MRNLAISIKGNATAKWGKGNIKNQYAALHKSWRNFCTKAINDRAKLEKLCKFKGCRYNACMCSSHTLRPMGVCMCVKSCAYAGKCCQRWAKTIYFYVSMFEIKICIRSKESQPFCGLPDWRTDRSGFCFLVPMPFWILLVWISVSVAAIGVSAAITIGVMVAGSCHRIGDTFPTAHVTTDALRCDAMRCVALISNRILRRMRMRMHVNKFWSHQW